MVLLRAQVALCAACLALLCAGWAGALEGGKKVEFVAGYDRVDYGGWKDCVKIGGEKVEVVVTTPVGPRIIRLALPGKENVFYEDPKTLGLTGGDTWRMYGGHRLWHAPEKRERTYPADNFPVTVHHLKDGVRFVPPPQKENGVQLEIDVFVAKSEPYVKVVHRIENIGRWEIELAPWALSVCAAGGFAAIPQPTEYDPEYLLPNRAVVLWPYTSMDDPRITWGRRFILVRQRAGTKPLKIGVTDNAGWIAYARKGTVFLKLYHYVRGAQYPDYGASVECYTNAEILEAETLGPLTRLAPGMSVEHVEHWFVWDGVDVRDTEESVAEQIVPLVERAREILG